VYQLVLVQIFPFLIDAIIPELAFISYPGHVIPLSSGSVSIGSRSAVSSSFSGASGHPRQCHPSSWQ
jgi:hypothetical protein